MKLSEGQRVTILVVAVFALVGLIFFWFVSSLFQEKAPPLSRNAVLTIALNGNIPERVPRDPLAEALGEKKMSVQDLFQVLRKAEKDRHVRALILRPQFPIVGLGKLQEIRQAILRFKASGKPVFAYLENAGKWDYYLASAADTVVGVGSGFMLLNGLLSQAIFLKGTLQSLGIEADFVAYGKYKNAPDMFTRDRMSPAQREVTNSLLDDIYPHFLQTIAHSRHLPLPRVRQLVDTGFFDFQKARTVGLIDTVMDYHQLTEYLKMRLPGKPRVVSFWRYRDIPMSKLGFKARHKLAVVFGVGSIVVGSADAFGQDGLITSEGMARAVRQAADNKQIKAIVLRVDSPGGSGTASDIIWQAVREARKKKPVVVSVGDVAASGGYYISMGADSIVAPAGSIVGSIGVFAGKFALGGLYKKIKMTKEELKRGRNADLFSDLKKFNPEQRRLMKQFIMDFYRQFVQKAAASRGMSYQQVDRIAQGRVWTGRQGLHIGLVDRLGDFYQAVQLAKRMSGIPEEETVQLVFYPRQKTLLEQLIPLATQGEMSHTASQLLNGFPESFRTVISAIPHLKNGEPLFLMPFFVVFH